MTSLTCRDEMNPVTPGPAAPANRYEWVPLNGTTYQAPGPANERETHKQNQNILVGFLKNRATLNLSPLPSITLFLESRGKLSWSVFGFPGPQFPCSREKAQLPQRVTQNNLTTSHKGHDHQPSDSKFHCLHSPWDGGWELYCQADLVPDVYVLCPPLLSYTQSKGLYQNCPVISAADSTTEFPVLQKMEGTGKFPQIPKRRTNNNTNYLHPHECFICHLQGKEAENQG